MTGSSSPGPRGAEGQSDPCLAHIRSGAGGRVTAGEPRGSRSSGTLGASGPVFLSLTHPGADPGGLGAERCGHCGCETVPERPGLGRVRCVTCPGHRSALTPACHVSCAGLCLSQGTRWPLCHSPHQQPRRRLHEGPRSPSALLVIGPAPEMSPARADPKPCAPCSEPRPPLRACLVLPPPELPPTAPCLAPWC